MILQALKEYYDRKPDLPRYGFEEKELAYVITLDKKGNPVSVESTYEGSGKDRRAKRFLVPVSVKRSVGIAANLLWDNPEYALGVVLKGKKRSTSKSSDDVNSRVAEQNAAFRRRIEDLGVTGDEGLEAVLKFLRLPNRAELLAAFGTTWTDLLKEGAYLSFKLAGDPGLVLGRAAVTNSIQAGLSRRGGGKTICLVSGETEPTKRLHDAIKGVWGAQTSGANIVSFNLEAFCSFGKEQGDNSPVGEGAAFAYTTALNHLLARDSRQRLQVGDASTVFWAEKATAFEEQIVSFFCEPQKDDPDRNARAVESLFRSPQSGTPPDADDSTRFYVLGLAPNASRIAIRFWIVNTVAGMAGNIRQHFEDLRITHGPRDRDAVSIFRLLLTTASQSKAENIVSNLAGDTMRAILEGMPYPQTLLQAAIRRIRAEHDIPHPRAALIKACINRKTRYANPSEKEELKVSLDYGNTSIGYRLGRLFAMLEKIQQDANPGINATIRDRFYGAASSTPVTVFGNLMRLMNHHMAKVEKEKPGLAVVRKQLLGEVMSGIPDFPAHLGMEEQGRFAIGYYHQMQKFFEKKAESTTNKEVAL